MFDVSKEELTPQNILKYVTEWDIMKTYVPDAVIGKHFFTPFDKETNPSAYLGNLGGRLILKDFGSTNKGLDCFGVVCKLFNLKFNESLEKIRADFGINNIVPGSIFQAPSHKPVLSGKQITTNVEKTILVKYRGWNLNDKAFWYSKYNIKLSTLQKFEVYPISHFWINNIMYTANKLSYLYDYFKADDGRDVVKIYQPYDYLKWISNRGHLQVIQGEGVLPQEGNLLLITKSLKDVMVLYEMGYTAIAPQSETTLINKQYFEKQMSRFNQLILFYDNDSTGLETSKQYTIPSIHIPLYHLQFGIKDISDFVNMYSFNEGKFLMENLIKNVY